MLSAYSDRQVLIEAINDNIFRFISKPSTKSEIDVIIKEAIEIYNYRLQNYNLFQKLIEANNKLLNFESEILLKPEFTRKDLYRLN